MRSGSGGTAENQPPKRLPPKALRNQSARDESTGANGVQSANANPNSAGMTPHPTQSRKDPVLPQAAARRKSNRKYSNKRRRRATRPTASVIHEDVHTSSVGTSSITSRKPSKRKRWDRTNSLDSDKPDQRSTKQLQCTTDDQPEALWKRWRQLEPRRGRRT